MTDTDALIERARDLLAVDTYTHGEAGDALTALLAAVEVERARADTAEAQLDELREWGAAAIERDKQRARAERAEQAIRDAPHGPHLPGKGCDCWKSRAVPEVPT